MPDQDPQPAEIQYLTMEDLEIAHEILAEVFADDEPVPSWEQGDSNTLATCRACIEVEAFGVRKYGDLPSAAAKLFYSTIKLHAFPNGNKRFALVLTLGLLVKNGARLTAPQGIGSAVAKWVADSDPHSPDGAPDRMIEILTKFYADNLAPWAPGEDWTGGWPEDKEQREPATPN
jgi:death-on-curing family protein